MSLGDYRMASSVLSLTLLLGNVSWVLPCALACIRRTPNAKLFGVSIVVFWGLACNGNCPLLGLLAPVSTMHDGVWWFYNIALAITLLVGVTSRSCNCSATTSAPSASCWKSRAASKASWSARWWTRTRELRNALIAAEAANLAKMIFWPASAMICARR